jgi:hypothetical protein
MWSVRFLLLVLALLVGGGTAAAPRSTEVLGAECETCAPYEATATRRNSTLSKRLRDRHIGEIDLLFAKEPRQRSDLRRHTDDEAALSESFGTAPPSRAPPAPVLRFVTI